MIRLFSGAFTIARFVKKIDRQVAKLEAALDHVSEQIRAAMARHDETHDQHNAQVARLKDLRDAKLAKLGEEVQALSAAHTQGKKLVQVISTIKNGTATCD